MSATQRTIAVALTGASGIAYGKRLLECLAGVENVRIWLVYSQVAQIVAHQELDWRLPVQPRAAERVLAEQFALPPGRLQVFGRDDWYAPLASGSNPPDALVVCPCSMGTLAAIACGLADSLIERAADVVLKEGRKLILVPRETPMSVLHLEHMLTLARAGACILPANPGFYHRPDSVAAVIDFIVARVLDQLGLPHDLMPRWGSERSAPPGDPTA